MRKHKIWFDKEEMIKVLGMYSIKELAAECHCNIKTVYAAMAKLSIPPPKYGYTRSYRRRGANSPKWKGGRRVSGDGYIRIYCPEHPHAALDGTVAEHRLIMEKKLNRYLLLSEKIHHIDGLRYHNTEDNLELVSPVNHSMRTQFCSQCSLRKQISLLKKTIAQYEVLLQEKLRV